MEPQFNAKEQKKDHAQIDSRINLPDHERGRQFLQDLIQPLSYEVTQHPLLQNFDSLSIDEMRLFAREFAAFVDLFPRILGGLIHTIEDPHIRQILVSNLVEECGGIEAVESGGIESTHPILYQKFLKALDIDPSWETGSLLPSTIHFLTEFKKLSLSPPLIALGAFGPGNESLSKKWIPVVRALRDRGFNESEIEFFVIHLPADDKHGSALQRVLAPYVASDGEAREQVSSGARCAVAARCAFYDGVYSEIVKRRNE